LQVVVQVQALVAPVVALEDLEKVKTLLFHHTQFHL
jgi:hypothetical protein